MIFMGLKLHDFKDVFIYFWCFGLSVNGPKFIEFIDFRLNSFLSKVSHRMFILFFECVTEQICFWFSGRGMEAGFASAAEWSSARVTRIRVPAAGGISEKSSARSSTGSTSTSTDCRPPSAGCRSTAAVSVFDLWPITQTHTHRWASDPTCSYYCNGFLETARHTRRQPSGLMEEPYSGASQ